MAKKTIFQKSYTRDTTLIIQQLWFKGLTNNLSQELGINHPYSPFGIDFVNDGVIEVWESVEARKIIKLKLVKKSHTHKAFLLKLLQEYQSELRKFTRIWKEGPIKTKKKLSGFIDMVGCHMTGDIVSCYLAEEYGVEKEIKNLAVKLRAEDTYFASNDFILRESLKVIFSELSEYVSCIRLEELDNNLPTVDECKSRYRHFVVDSQGYFSSEDLNNYLQKNPSFVFQEDKVFNTSIIEGRAAVKGKVKGPVKILKKITDIDKVNAGDIIVSPMTTPVFLPALIKAAAIVTDEGGVICHAAIVSRELGKPCIIGTKIATQILKEGDLVEVDADKGIVRKVTRND